MMLRQILITISDDFFLNLLNEMGWQKQTHFLNNGINFFYSFCCLFDFFLLLYYFIVLGRKHFQGHHYTGCDPQISIKLNDQSKLNVSLGICRVWQPN